MPNTVYMKQCFHHLIINANEPLSGFELDSVESSVVRSVSMVTNLINNAPIRALNKSGRS